jgi:hypothetical protein
MATLQGLAGLVEASNKTLDENGNPINPVTTVSFIVSKDGELQVDLTFRKGLDALYEHGDSIFDNFGNPITIDNQNTQILDNAKNLEQILNIDDDKTGIGFDSPDARKLNQTLNKPTDSQKIEIEADAAVESTITDTADINIHLESVKMGKVEGGVETKFTPAALASVINQLETSYQQQTPQTPAFDIPIQAQDLQMLDPRNIQTIDSNIQSTEVTEFVTPDAVITLTGNPPVMQVKVDKNADLEKVQAQLDGLAKTNSFGPNSEILVKEAMQKLSSRHEFAQQENQILVVGDINKPVPQINKPAEYNGIAASQQLQKTASI